ncbi:hypothetical protein INT45_013543 [Circinella minor]|uniref:Uncharacterized protein n=1 Tax=Circinella minor TaxID=1195481 RepID=A0A8H7S735_9FUNG|nr:hypothetical protein INT45_013543 [Circinella minor]
MYNDREIEKTSNDDNTQSISTLTRITVIQSPPPAYRYYQDPNNYHSVCNRQDQDTDQYPPPYQNIDRPPPPLTLLESYYRVPLQQVPVQDFIIIQDYEEDKEEETRTLYDYISSWKMVLKEGKWVFFGCCSCILIILFVIVIAITLNPGIR